jgi:hypothetical protein
MEDQGQRQLQLLGQPKDFPFREAPVHPSQPLLVLQIREKYCQMWKTQSVDAFLIFRQEVDQFQLDHRYQISFLFTHIA